MMLLMTIETSPTCLPGLSSPLRKPWTVNLKRGILPVVEESTGKQSSPAGNEQAE